MNDVATRVRPGLGEGNTSPRILLAEDQPVNQRVATAMLEHLGFQVDAVSDGAQAVNAASRTPYRAILMDCQIPVLDGYQATGQIRRAEGDARHTPIIAVTASTAKTDQERCLDAGMDDYLTKPLSLKALATVLDLWAVEGSGRTDVVNRLEGLGAAEVDTPPWLDLDPPNLDVEVIERLERLGMAVGEDLMGQLAVLFLTDADKLVIALREGLAANDAAAVAFSAHTLRGSSANLGATYLSRLCATLELEGDEGSLVGGEALLDAIGGELMRVRSALDSRIPAL